jgi:hypothetical protein
MSRNKYHICPPRIIFDEISIAIDKFGKQDKIRRKQTSVERKWGSRSDFLENQNRICKPSSHLLDLRLICLKNYSFCRKYFKNHFSKYCFVESIDPIAFASYRLINSII